MCAYIIDSETPAEEEFFKNLTTSFFGNDSKHIKWSAPDDPPSEETHLSRHAAEATARAKEIMTDLLTPKEANASS